MWTKAKKWLAISTNSIILIFMTTNVAIAWHYVVNFAIPSIAYAITVSLMIIINNTDRHVSRRIDFFDHQDFNNANWQNRQLRLLPVFVIFSLIFASTLLVIK